jgi:membrane-anchored protein YejM (alkaline phosphatase superfamily)
VPQISGDQVVSDLMTWLGLPSDKLIQVMPNLANFAKKNVGFMNG